MKIINNIKKFKNGLGEKGLKRFKNASFAIIMCAVAGTSTVVLAADDIDAFDAKTLRTIANDNNTLNAFLILFPFRCRTGTHIIDN